MTREVSPPPKIWVGEYEFSLHFLLPDDPEMEGADGITRFDEQDRGISISASLDDRKMLEIVWHEVTHAINWICGITNKSRSEELLARKHGLAWSAFHLDNPKFVRWYTHVVNRIRKARTHG
jgi:hypothetical protein